MRLSSTAVLVVTALALIACGGGGSSSDSGGPNGQTPAGGNDTSMALSTEAFHRLSPLAQYDVANKAMGVFYKGIPAADWFDLSNGLAPLMVKGDAPGIAEIKSALSAPLADKLAILSSIDEKYRFDERTRPLQYPLAMLHEFPLSRDQFVVWMAYQLANTILFSPAVELETCDHTDIQDVFQRLASMLENDADIRDIVYAHMISQENWRRFRSPEDNTREMMEIFLGRFKDEEVPLAALTCQNWGLTDESRDYQLIIVFDENEAPQPILDTTVTGCHEFYQAVADHADLIPRITAVLVDLFLTRSPSDIRQQMTEAIVARSPRRFEEIFIPIVFSREFLLNCERPGRLEERFFNIAQRIDWWANRSFFRYINHAYASSSYPSLRNMRQAAMTYKLGRTVEIPLDTLSFSYFHKSVRERLLLDRRTDEANADDGGWQASFIDVPLADDEFIQYIFLSVISRMPSEVELTTLRQIMDDRRYNSQDHKRHQAMIVMDYLSRLSETYYINAVNG